MCPRLSLAALLVLVCGLAVLAFGACVGWPTSPPAPTPDLSCALDADCVIAARLDKWCHCGDIYNRGQVEDSPSLLLVWERYEYPYRTPRTTPRPVGPTPACGPCFYPLGAICANGLCRLPENREEMLRLCSELTDPQRSAMCYHQAAAMALTADGVQAAVETCGLLPALEERDACKESAVYWGLLNRGDPSEAAAFCLENLPLVRHSYCLKTAAESLAETDPEAAIQMCRDMPVGTPDDQWQQDACFSNSASIVALTNLVQARQICELISGATDLTRLDCLRYVQDSLVTVTPLVAPEPTGIPAPTAVD